ncbi:MAG: M36 family metallopeptidase [Thermoanaerobaculia bacterium]|jgi:uncharacterized repeat protein (TIGR01451 family)
MMLSRSGRKALSTFAFLLVAWSLPLAAAVAPPAREKGAQLDMLDARVNLKDALQRASDARPGKAATGLEIARQQLASITAATTAKARTMPGLEVRLSGYSAGPEIVRNHRGALTSASSQSNESIVRAFLNQNGALYGLSTDDLEDLVVLGDSAGGDSGLRMLRMEQRIDGRPVFQSETRFIVDRNGRLISSMGRMVPHARAIAPKGESTLTPIEAIIRLLAAEGQSASAASFSVPPSNGEWIQIEENDDYIGGTISARQVLFPLSPGHLVPAWALVVFTTGDQDWYALIDAETGDLLWRKNIRDSASAHDARFRVFVQADGTTPADSPAPSSPNAVAPGSGTQFPFLSPTIVSMHTAMDPIASPNGWIDDCPGGVCTANETQTLGNNTITCLDRISGADVNLCDTAASSVLDGNGRPTGNPDANTRNRDFLGTTPRDFQTNFLPPPQITAADAEVGQTATGNGNNGTLAIDFFRRGAVTHLFYITNWYHDRLYALGFDEAAGNFQQTNFSGMGLGGDRVNGDAQDSGPGGTSVNNANFATPPDGVSGRMQMFRFTSPTIDRDGGLDAEIVIHELTHGTSNRLVGNGAGLNWDIAGGMGEGWSDFYALSLLNNTNADDPDARYSSGAYATYKLGGLLDNYAYGIRRFPYSTDNSVNPMTWADVDDTTNSLAGGMAPSPLNFNGNGGMEVHNAGEIWALTLWEVRSRVIADPAGANGDVPTGNQTMLQLVTDGLKMTPIDPKFTDARDAILDADCATNACANEDSVWGGFADRGLGYGAGEPYYALFGYTAGHLGLRESFSQPYLDVVNAATDVAIDDSASNNNGRIDPGEAIRLTVSLTNPWRAASKNVASATATLATATPGVTVYDNTATWGAIAAQATAAASDSFLIALDTTVTCGSSINFTLTTTSSLGTTATNFTLRVGNANGTDPVVTYTKDTSPDLAITDGQPLASAIDTLNITDDFQIADLDFRLDSVTHTYTGDLTFMLRSPGSIGVDFISVIGGIVDGGSGDNILNMVCDDDIANVAANDMVQVLPTAAPYTKSWIPVFNGPGLALGGLPPADPVGNLSRFDGTSTLGTWKVAVSDQFSVDSGTLNAWSILVTPVHFDCIAFAPSALLAATKTVSGTFQVGGTVTYTVTVTNSGTDNQADNTGNEFVDTLPAGLTLVSAIATSGTATANVVPNQVTWNGSIAPLGGSVTITITATVNNGTEGTTVSNQGTVAYDSNNDNVNDASALTDDPGVGGATDPTNFAVAACGAATITPTPAQVCANSTGNTASGPAGAASYAWSITNGTITSATNIQTITYTAGASGTVDLVLYITDAPGCRTGSANVTINPAPATPTITPGGPTTFCAGGSVLLTSSSATGNQWYLDGNPIGGETNQTYSAIASGNYTVVVTTSGCSSAASSATTVTVNPIPATPTITPDGPTTFCAGGSVTLTSSSATGNQWYLNGNPIGGETNQTYVASGAGDYTVVVTTSGCSSAPSATTTVTVNPNPDATITAPGSVLQGSSGHTASVADAGAGATYTWGATNGIIDSGNGTNSISFTAGTPAVTTLDVTVTTAAGCSDTKSAFVTVTTLPTVSVTSVTPNNGSMLGGTPVTIAGSNFVSGATVTFDGLAATSVVFVNSTQITAKTPAHAIGAVNVLVTNPDTSSGSLTNGYTYVTRQFDPNGDTFVDPSDIFYLVNYLYSGGPAPAGASGMSSGDANGDGVVDPADIFYTVNYLFLSGPVPYVTTPKGAKPEAASGRFEGSISLGQARAKNGRFVVPVIVTMKPGSILPRAMSLDVRVEGGTTIVGAHRVAGIETAFEISRTRGQGIAYLVSFSEASQLRLNQYGSITIAELELGSAQPSRLEIDPELTMLVDGRGTRKATVKDSTLTLEGVDVGDGKAPKTKVQGQ